MTATAVRYCVVRCWRIKQSDKKKEEGKNTKKRWVTHTPFPTDLIKSTHNSSQPTTVHGTVRYIKSHHTRKKNSNGSSFALLPSHLPTRLTTDNHRWPPKIWTGCNTVASILYYYTTYDNTTHQELLSHSILIVRSPHPGDFVHHRYPDLAILNSTPATTTAHSPRGVQPSARSVRTIKRVYPKPYLCDSTN